MGFSEATTALTQFMSGRAEKAESRNMNGVAVYQLQDAARQAGNKVAAASKNQLSAQRNANSAMASARADAAASNLADDGTVHMREMDLATRLEKQIADDTNAVLKDADTVVRQGILDAWDSQNRASQAEYRSRISKFSGINSLISGALKTVMSFKGGGSTST